MALMDRNVRIVGVPMNLGADRRGVDTGPSAVRYAGLDVACTDCGDVHVPRPEETDPDVGAPVTGDGELFVETEAVCTRLGHEVAGADFPLILGGDHSIDIGTASRVSQESETGTVWFDAHGDCSTPVTTPSGNAYGTGRDGTGLAAIHGKRSLDDTDWAPAPNVSAENVALVSLRSVDECERETLRDSDVAAYTMSDIDARGVTEALGVTTDGTDGVRVSLDLYWLDPTEAPGVGTPERGGVSQEAHAATELIAERAADPGQLTSMELVEVTPLPDEHN